MSFFLEYSPITFTQQYRYMAKHQFTTEEDQLPYNGIVIDKVSKIDFNSSANNIKVFNRCDTKDVLFRGASLKEIVFYIAVYDSLAKLSKELAPLLSESREFYNEYN